MHSSWWPHLSFSLCEEGRRKGGRVCEWEGGREGESVCVWVWGGGGVELERKSEKVK